MRICKTVIIGSGVIGATIAFHLSKKQKDILVIDKGFPSRGTSGSTQAWVWVHTKQPSFYGELSMLSSELYINLKKEVPLDFEFKRTGGLSLIFNDEKLEETKKLIERQKNYGIKIDLLSKEEVLKKEPKLTPNLLGATYSSLDGHLNPFRLLWALIEGASKNGVEFSFNNPLTALKRKDGYYEVNSEKETILAEKLVIAGGPWSKMIAGWLDVDVPIKLVKGQILVTEPLAPLLKHVLSGVRQTNNGELIVGYSKEESGFDRSTSYHIIGETARYLMKIFPSLKDINIVRAFSGIRVMPQDGLPILGEVPGHRNLFVAATHSGITLCPIIGLLMSEVINGEEPSLPIDPYLIKRFYESKQQEKSIEFNS